MNKKIQLILVFLCLLNNFCVANTLPADKEKLLLQRFPAIDKNSDQKISVEELEEGMSRLPSRAKRIVQAFLDNNKSQSGMSSESKTSGRRKSVDSVGDLGLNIEKRITFLETESGPICLDLIHPKVKVYEKAPVFIYIHGGGYVGGTRAKIYNHMDLIKALTEKGIAIASVDYRLANAKHKAKMNIINQDCKDAMRFLAKNSEKYNLDRHKFMTWGTSAGGSLALISALTEPDYLPGSISGDVEHTVLGGIVYFGMTTFLEESVLKARADSSRNLFDANNGLSQDDILKMTSPDLFLKKNSPPLLLFHGNRDPIVTVKHSRYLNEKAKKIKADLTYIEVEGGDHGFTKSSQVPSKNEIYEIMLEHVSEWLAEST